MPNRQEVLDALRILSEEVLESLRVLFYMLFTMTRAVIHGRRVEEHVARKWHKTHFVSCSMATRPHRKTWRYVKEMLSRIDNKKPVEGLNQFDEALRQCFHARDTMSVVDGYSPQQAALGKATKLPASIIVDDEDLSAHLASHGTDLASDRFRRRLELRTAARAAFATLSEEPCRGSPEGSARHGPVDSSACIGIDGNPLTC